ncbi:MAG: hypothetical protein LC768_12690 [Acidobacteria bacterium]|nr:hypothetical protein [Acidobacteriota bacterium]MCA1639169.1 hypothetical protein [Acidobacteriota bacterium]
METAIIIVWSATLVVALILTLWILKLVFLIVRTEKDIIKLAMTTLTASHGIERNTALISGLEATKGVAGKILNTAMAIEAGSSSIKQKLQGVEKALRERSL